MANHSEEKRHEISVSDIQYEETIGKGSFGHVFRVKLKTYDNDEEIKAAAKKVPLSKTSDEELKVLSRLKHKNIIGYLGFIKEQTTLTIVTELAVKGDLHTYLHSNKPLADDLKKKWITEAAEALHYLHQNQFIHRDVKSSNFLISVDDILKLGDFGTSGYLDETENTAHGRGTARWMAPEVIKTGTRSTKSDVYSYGIVTWEICTHEVPYSRLETKAAIMDAVVSGRRPVIPRECPVVFQKIIRKCWLDDYHERPPMEDVVQLLNQDEGLCFDYG